VQADKGIVMSKKQETRFFRQRKNQFGIIVLVAMVLAIFVFNRPEPKTAQVAYLYPFNGAIPNIWLASVDNPADARQLTFTKMGVHGFDVSYNGRSIAYTMRDEDTSTRNTTNYILCRG
jgi:hypothetical protein